MKTIFKIAALIIVTASVSGFTQRYGSGTPSATDVSGIFIGGKYTKPQVVAKWGTPTSYRSNTSEFGVNETYKYSTNLFRFSDDGVYVDTPAFVVLAAKNGGVKVGDALSKLSALSLGNPLLQSDGSYQLGQGDDQFLFGVANGKIIWISYISSM